jgi:hypothetical protein
MNSTGKTEKYIKKKGKPFQVIFVNANEKVNGT